MMTEPITDDRQAAVLAARVRIAFERVHRERMSAMPFVNGALRVDVVGLRRWRGLWLGVLVTPWFMNLLLLPGDGAATEGEAPARWPALAVGDSTAFSFPSGRFEFIVGREAEAGEYLACSLFSPMFEFTDHDSARQTAEACLAALFDEDAAAPAADIDLKPAAVSKRDFLRGRWQADAAPAARERR
jgi:[NiFe] hydrogenase assembly HybE family chaperone